MAEEKRRWVVLLPDSDNHSVNFIDSIGFKSKFVSDYNFSIFSAGIS